MPYSLALRCPDGRSQHEDPPDDSENAAAARRLEWSVVGVRKTDCRSSHTGPGDWIVEEILCVATPDLGSTVGLNRTTGCQADGLIGLDEYLTAAFAKSVSDVVFTVGGIGDEQHSTHAHKREQRYRDGRSDIAPPLGDPVHDGDGGDRNY